MNTKRIVSLIKHKSITLPQMSFAMSKSVNFNRVANGVNNFYKSRADLRGYLAKGLSDVVKRDYINELYSF